MPGPLIRIDPLPYVDALAERALDAIDLAIIHCTELTDLTMAREFGERVLYADSGTGNSGHYYIDRDGGIVEYVPAARIAHHTRGYNPRSIGIELVNTGRYPDWMDSRRQAMDECYTEAQIVALIGLLNQLVSRITSLNLIAGHEDLDTASVPASNDPSVLVRRKLDPGPMFPWRRILDSVSLQRLNL